FETFKTAIDAALRRADAELAKGTPRAELYAALIRDGATSAPPGSEPGSRGPIGVVMKATLSPDQPVKGRADAKVTMIMVSDFQCPFCGRVQKTLKQIEATYGDDIRFVWANNPLSFHPAALPAALAAMAAHGQGKFWAFHDRLFADQQHEDAATF